MKIILLPIVALLIVCGSCSRNSTISADTPSPEKVRAIGMINNPDACREAIRQNPNDADAHMCVAEVSIGRNNTVAISELREVLRLRPKDRKAKFLLAQTLVKVGERQEARDLYKELSSENDAFGKAALRNFQRLEKR